MLDPIILAYNCTPVTRWTKRVLVILIIDVQYTFIPKTDENGLQVTDHTGKPIKKKVKRTTLQVVNPHSGELAVWEGDKIINPINAMIGCRKRENTHVVLGADSHTLGHGATNKLMNVEAFTQGYLDGVPQTAFFPHGIIGSRGQKFPAELALTGQEIVVEKGGDNRVDSFSAMYDNCHKNKTGLAAFLRKLGVTDIAVVGLAYEYGVGSTALDAAMEGFKTYVVKEGTRAFPPKSIDNVKLNFNIPGVEEIDTITALQTKFANAGVEIIGTITELFQHSVLKQFFDQEKVKAVILGETSLEDKDKSE